MNGKSLSPRIKNPLNKAKIILKKLNSLQKFPLLRQNDSNINNSNQDSIAIPKHPSNLNSVSTSKLNLQLSSSRSMNSFRASQNKLKAMISKCPAPYIPQPTTALSEQMLPMSSEQALLHFASVLSKYEQQELLHFSDIYYLGLKANKVRPTGRLKNRGFDDKDTDYIMISGDHLAYQYEIIELLGSGSFSQVCKCLDHKSKREVAVKIIKSHKRFVQQGQVELKVLEFIKKHEKSSPSSFVQILTHFTFRGHLCIVFELLSYNLYDLLKANAFKGFSLTLVRRFVTQILKGLILLQANRIIHCDLKPENLVLISPNESLIKIIDLGSSCFEDEKIYYYIQSRIYRAPEVILGVPYTIAIDMWSLGCIAVELFTGFPLFQGEDEADQLMAIIEVLGYPPKDVLKVAGKRSEFFHSDGNLREFVNSKGIVRKHGALRLEDRVKCDNALFLDFIRSKIYVGCLVWEPETRITPSEAMVHPWIDEVKKINMVKGVWRVNSPRIKVRS